MNEPHEFTGSTVDDAVASGIEALGVTPGDVIVEVLEEPARGVFGIGSRPARVRLKLLRPPAPDPVEEAPPTVEEVDAPDTVAADTFTEDGEPTDGGVARQVLLELLEKMGVRGRVTIHRAEAHPDEEDDNPWVLDIEGADVNLLIGRKGETLAALQYIVRLITSRRLERRANIVVDAGGYKSRRTDRLEQLAVRMADQAISTGQTVALEPMPANERRIIHMTLRNRENVETRSAGEGDSRKVTIIPT